jgi:hypothetical protein
MNIFINIQIHCNTDSFSECKNFKLKTQSYLDHILSFQLTSIDLIPSYRLVTRPGARDVEGVDPMMGVYLGLRIPGVVKNGDPIYVGCE